MSENEVDIWSNVIDQNTRYEEEMAKIKDPVELEAFRFFFDMTAKEGMPVLPYYTWGRFQNGIAKLLNADIKLIDQFVIENELIPNYTKEITELNKLDNVQPMLDTLKSGFVQNMHKSLETGSVRVIANHPSLSSPLILARCLIEAFQTEYGEDIRENMYVVYGAYPTTMRYEVQLPTGEKPIGISPVDLGLLMANLVLTAPNTANTKTDDNIVNQWLQTTRAGFIKQKDKILSEKGNIFIVLPAGRRSTYLHEECCNIEYAPGGTLDYMIQPEGETYLIGIDDDLLNHSGNNANLASEVHVIGNEKPQILTTRKEVIRALGHCVHLANKASGVQDKYKLRSEKSARNHITELISS